MEKKIIIIKNISLILFLVLFFVVMFKKSDILIDITTYDVRSELLINNMSSLNAELQELECFADSAIQVQNEYRSMTLDEQSVFIFHKGSYSGRFDVFVKMRDEQIKEADNLVELRASCKNKLLTYNVLRYSMLFFSVLYLVLGLYNIYQNNRK